MFFAEMNNAPHVDLPVWAWVLIGMFAIVGIFVSVWGFAGGFKIWSKDKQKNTKTDINKLLKKSSYKFSDLDALPAEKIYATYAIFFGKSFNDKDFFIPMYISETSDFSTEIRLHAKKMVEKNPVGIYSQMIEYMKIKEMTAEDIKFVLIQEREEKSHFESASHWISKYNLDKRGFNK
ncbi:hypothetical protein [[Acholeplasma] multilocale]|uniref:hypothetical protein n=1 Tax=[Acholeplasma] multilocale TaxID=264638 RepID=UPI00047B1C0A|nr:hypothetical protein [[Acholeplasma] multilocale]